jgi:hypothetical protein
MVLTFWYLNVIVADIWYFALICVNHKGFFKVYGMGFKGLGWEGSHLSIFIYVKALSRFGLLGNNFEHNSLVNSNAHLY